MKKEILRMKFLSGIISESVYNERLNDNANSIEQSPAENREFLISELKNGDIITAALMLKAMNYSDEEIIELAKDGKMNYDLNFDHMDDDLNFNDYDYMDGVKKIFKERILGFLNNSNFTKISVAYKEYKEMKDEGPEYINIILGDVLDKINSLDKNKRR